MEITFVWVLKNGHAIRNHEKRLPLVIVAVF